VNVEPPDLSSLSPRALDFGSKPAELIPADAKWGRDLPAGLAAVDERWQNLMVGTKAELESCAGGALMARVEDDSPQRDKSRPDEGLRPRQRPGGIRGLYNMTTTERRLSTQ
jgi:hypothetical protein